MAEEMELIGIVRDHNTIELVDGVRLPAGSKVRLKVVVENQAESPPTDGAEETLRLIYRMRHSGRSIRQP